MKSLAERLRELPQGWTSSKRGTAISGEDAQRILALLAEATRAEDYLADHVETCGDFYLNALRVAIAAMEE